MNKLRKQRIIDECFENGIDYYNFLKNKKIIIVGPSGNLIGQKLGKRIDSYDVVVRLNNSISIPLKYKKDLGTRTDVIYHISGKILDSLRYVGTRTHRDVRTVLRDDKLKYIMFKQGWNSKGKKSRNHFWKFVSLNPGVKISPIRKTLIDLKSELNGTDPNMGILAITHILKSKCNSLTVIGCDFYGGKYYPGYIILPEYKFDFKERRLKSKDGSWIQKQKHSIREQLYYLDKLWKFDKRLVLCKELINLIKNKESEKR